MYRPPKGVAPAHLEGKRTGRPKGTKNHATAYADAVWGFEHRDDDHTKPPTVAARLWRDFAQVFPHELAYWLEERGHL